MHLNNLPLGQQRQTEFVLDHESLARVSPKPIEKFLPTNFLQHKEF